MISLDCELTPKDYVKAQYLHMRPRPILRWLGIGLLVLLAWGLYYSWHLTFVDEKLDWAFWLLLGASIYLLVLFVFIVPYRTRKVYRQQKSLQIPYVVHVDEEGLRTESEIGNAKIPWEHFIRWRENSHLFLMYYSDPLFHLIPKRAFSDGKRVDEFRERLEAKIGPAT